MFHDKLSKTDACRWNHNSSRGIIFLLRGSAALVLALVTAPSQEQFEIKVSVDLVEMHATVHDKKGISPTDLQRQHFSVYEDGVRQTIQLFQREDIPLTVGLVVDHSKSMRGKLDDVVAAAQTFAKSRRPEDEMFVVNFNENVVAGLPAGVPFTNRAADLSQAILNPPTEGLTALYNATFVALNHLKSGTRDKKVLLIISDGADNASKHTLKEVLQLAAETGAIVYTIGIGTSEEGHGNRGVLKKLAKQTGGQAYFPAALNEAVELCERIASEVRNQYTLGYVAPSAGSPGVFRSVRVEASAPAHGKLKVRTRTGYFHLARKK